MKAPYFPFSANLPQQRSGRPAVPSPTTSLLCARSQNSRPTLGARLSAPSSTGRSRGGREGSEPRSLGAKRYRQGPPQCRPLRSPGTQRLRPTPGAGAASATAGGRPAGRGPGRLHPPRRARPRLRGPEEDDDGGDPARARPRPPSQPPRAALTRHCSISRRSRALPAQPPPRHVSSRVS